MGLFAKKINPVFTDQEFVAAKDIEILETQIQERKLGILLFTPEQRAAIDENRRATFLAVSGVVVQLREVSVPKTEGKILPPEPIQIDLPVQVENENTPLDKYQPLGPSAVNEPIEARDPFSPSMAESDEKAFNADPELMGEKKLRERIKKLESDLKAAVSFRPWVKWGSRLGYFAILISGVSTCSTWALYQRHRDDLYRVVGDNKPDLLAQIDYEQKRGRQLESNFAVSEYYRQADNCQSGLTIIYLKSENLNLSGIRYKPKVPAVCKELADYERQINQVFDDCKKAADYSSKDVVEPRIKEGIEKHRAVLKEDLAKLPKSYADYLTSVGYDQCKKVLPKKK